MMEPYLLMQKLTFILFEDKKLRATVRAAV